MSHFERGYEKGAADRRAGEDRCTHGSREWIRGYSAGYWAAKYADGRLPGWTPGEEGSGLGGWV